MSIYMYYNETKSSHFIEVSLQYQLYTLVKCVFGGTCGTEASLNYFKT